MNKYENPELIEALEEDKRRLGNASFQIGKFIGKDTTLNQLTIIFGFEDGSPSIAERIRKKRGLTPPIRRSLENLESSFIEEFPPFLREGDYIFRTKYPRCYVKINQDEEAPEGFQETWENEDIYIHIRWLDYPLEEIKTKAIETISRFYREGHENDY